MGKILIEMCVRCLITQAFKSILHGTHKFAVVFEDLESEIIRKKRY